MYSLFPSRDPKTLLICGSQTPAGIMYSYRLGLWLVITVLTRPCVWIATKLCWGTFRCHFVTHVYINLFSFQDLVSTVCKPPDHSVIWLKVNISSYGVKETESILSENTQSNDVRIHNVDTTVPSSRYFERYNLHKNSDRFMNNESWRLALNDVINHN